MAKRNPLRESGARQVKTGGLERAAVYDCQQRAFASDAVAAPISGMRIAQLLVRDSISISKHWPAIGRTTRYARLLR